MQDLSHQQVYSGHTGPCKQKDHPTNYGFWNLPVHGHQNQDVGDLWTYVYMVPLGPKYGDAGRLGWGRLQGWQELVQGLRVSIVLGSHLL